MSSIVVEWRARDTPIEPRAVVGVGAAAIALADRVRLADRPLQGVATDDVIVLLGNEADLPWVDGVRYLGRVPEAPSLLVPTHLEPSVPLVLLERMLTARYPDAGIPLAVIVDGAGTLVVPVAAARPIAVGPIEEWLARATARRAAAG